MLNVVTWMVILQIFCSKPASGVGMNVLRTRCRCQWAGATAQLPVNAG